MRHLIAQYEHLPLSYMKEIGVGVPHHTVVNIHVPAFWGAFSGILMHRPVGGFPSQTNAKIGGIFKE